VDGENELVRAQTEPELEHLLEMYGHKEPDEAIPSIFGCDG